MLNQLSWPEHSGCHDRGTDDWRAERNPRMVLGDTLFGVKANSRCRKVGVVHQEEYAKLPIHGRRRQNRLPQNKRCDQQTQSAADQQIVKRWTEKYIARARVRRGWSRRWSTFQHSQFVGRRHALPPYAFSMSPK